MPPHPLTNFEIQEYHQNEPRFNGVYSRDDLSKIKDGEYAINLNELELIGLLCQKKIMILLILIVLGQIMFQKGLKHLSVKKT